MKLREKFKRFWTMNVHNHEGFTLVELIIVIAILAILSSVAVVGYSSYIKKANMQADKTLVAEIKNALNLAMYSDPFEAMPVGVLVLSKDGITMSDGSAIPADSEVYAVLTAAFGSLDGLKLKYEGWEVAAYLNGMSVGEATAVKLSSFLSGNRSDKLLTDVEMFTSMAANLAKAMGQVTGDTTLGTLFTKDLLDKTAEKYNIEGPADGNWDKWGEENPEEFSNLLVLATAMDSQNKMEGKETATSTELVLAFSTYYAFASTCPEFSIFLDGHMAKLDDVDSPSEGGTWYSTLTTEAKKDTYKNAAGQTYAEYSADSNQGKQMDNMAFTAIMASLNKTTADDINGELGNANLFTEGAVKDVYDQYMNAVDALSGGLDMTQTLQLAKGQVAIIYNQGTFVVIDTIGE